MDKRILELALETLEKRKAAIDAEIQSIKTQLNGGIRSKTVAPAAGKRKARTAAQRKAQSKLMKEIWAEKRARRIHAAKKAIPPKPKKGPKSAAARKAQSERMKAYWAKKKAGK